MDLSFISDYRVLISDVIQIVAWLIVIYKLYRRPENEQNEKIDLILEKLEKIENSEITGLENSIKLLLKRLFARTCIECIKKQYVTESDSDIIESLYQEYHYKYGMNGRGEDLYKKVLALPLKDMEDI